MIEIQYEEQDAEMIDFGKDGRVLFQLPALGSKNIPFGLTAAFAVFWAQNKETRAANLRDTISAWNSLFFALKDAYPEAARYIGMLPRDAVSDILQHWFSESSKRGFEGVKPA